MAMPIEKLKKVVDMATRGGSAGERANAERIARKACEELGIPYADAVKGDYGPHGNNEPDLGRTFWGRPDPGFGGDPNPFGRGHDFAKDFWGGATYTQNPNWQHAQRNANVFWQEKMEKRAKMAAYYKDKHGDVWSGTEVATLIKSRRYHLFGKDPLI